MTALRSSALVSAALVAFSLSGCASREPTASARVLEAPIDVSVAFSDGTGTLLHVQAPQLLLDFSGQEWNVLPIAAASPQSTGPSYVTFWSPSSGSFVRWGQEGNWIDAHLPEQAFVGANHTAAYLVALGFTVSARAGASPVTLSTGQLAWNVSAIDRHDSLVMASTTVPGEGIVRVTFKLAASGVIPNEISVDSWEIPWRLHTDRNSHASSLPFLMKVSALPRDKPHPVSVPEVSPPSVDRPAPNLVPWQRFGTSDRGIWAPVSTGAFSVFGLDEAVATAADDPRLSDYLSAHPNAYVIQASRAPFHEMATAGQDWGLWLAEGCGRPADQQLVVVVRKTMTPVPLGPMVSQMAGPAPCQSSATVAWESATKASIDWAVASNAAQKSGVTISPEASVYYTTKQACQPTSPWAQQLAVKDQSHEAWVSLGTGHVLTVRSSRPNFVQVVECPPFMPDGFE